MPDNENDLQAKHEFMQSIKSELILGIFVLFMIFGVVWPSFFIWGVYDARESCEKRRPYICSDETKCDEYQYFNAQERCFVSSVTHLASSLNIFR